MSEKRDGFFANLFDSYKQTIILILMLIAYLIIPAGIAVLGYWLQIVYLGGGGWLDYGTMITEIGNILITPQLIVQDWPYFIILAAALMAVVSFAAAFLFTASRNDRINKPLGFFKAYLGSWGILFTYVIIAGIFFGAWFGLAFLEIDLLTEILWWVAIGFSGLSLVAMIFRTVDYLLELE
jgi:hypothetical protein